jgi:membrane fusion protein, multidrug efflux system
LRRALPAGEERGMRKPIVRWSFAVLAVAAVVALGGCGKKEAAVATAEKVPVETVQVGVETVSPSVSYSGTVVPWRRAYLGAQIQGRVEKMHVDVGDRVTKGDLLVELAGEQLTEARARFTAVESDYHRMQALADKGAVSPQAFEQAKAGYEAAKAGYDLVAASAQLRAPFSGIVSARYLDEGEVYTLMSMTTPSPAVLELVKIDTVKVEIQVAEREKSLVVPGLSASVVSGTQSGRTFDGRVDRVDPGLDRMSRTATADIVVSNPGEVLRPGMFADVQIELASREALLVPRDALVRQEGTAVFYVYAVDGGVAKRRELRLGDSFGSSVEVLDGLAEGDVIVTAGRYRLHDGAEVEVVEPSTPSAVTEEGGR